MAVSAAWQSQREPPHPSPSQHLSANFQEGKPSQPSQPAATYRERWTRWYSRNPPSGVQSNPVLSGTHSGAALALAVAQQDSPVKEAERKLGRL